MRPAAERNGRMTGSREETVIDAVPRHSVASDGPRARIIGEEYINYLAAAGNAPSDLRDGDVYWRSTMRLLSGRRLLLFAFLFIPALFSSCSTGNKSGPLHRLRLKRSSLSILARSDSTTRSSPHFERALHGS